MGTTTRSRKKRAVVSQALGGEGRQRAELAGLRHLSQEAGGDFRAELTRRPADRARQIGEALRLCDGQPHQRHPFIIQMSSSA